MITITTISDTHGKHDKINVGSGDLIIHSGDCTPRGKKEDIEEFVRWYGDLEFEKKILIAGNHDWDFAISPEYCEELCLSYGVTYLNDSGTKFKGLHIWGSPVSPVFHNWAYNRASLEDLATLRHPFIGKHWDKIPANTDILITHCPAYGILDLTYHSQEKAGCNLLRKKIEEIRPVLHVFGHIHEGRGIYIDKNGPTTHVNASSLDLAYDLYPEDPFKFDWNSLITGHSHGED